MVRLAPPEVAAGASPPGAERPERLELLRQYFDEIGRIPLLTAAEERELARSQRVARRELLAELASIPFTARVLLERWQELAAARRVTGQLSQLQDGSSDLSAEVDRAALQIRSLLKRRDRLERDKAARSTLERIDGRLRRIVEAVQPTSHFLDSVLDQLRELAASVSWRRPDTGLRVEVGLTRGMLRKKIGNAEAAFGRGRAARDRFVRHNLRLVVHTAKKFRHMGVPFLDLIQEGNLGLLRAVEKFDERRGNRFSTYGIWWIQQSCVRAIQGASRTVRLPSHIFDGVRRYRNARDAFEGRHGRSPSAAELAPALGMATQEVETLKRADSRIVTLDASGPGDDLPLGERLPSPHGSEGPEAVADATLSASLALLLRCLAPRERLILSWRFGLGDDHDRTLEDIGQELGLSRERVRQIEKEALRKLRDRAPDGLESLLAGAPG